MIAHVRCPRLVAREAELTFLRERCNEARLGRGSLVFVNGEAGIGKTRLVDEVVRHGAAHAMQHASSFCLEHARSPLGPLADIIRALHAADNSVLTVARSVRRILARLVAELDPDVSPVADAQGARSQYAAITEMFRRYGERHASVLVIEDAHWADISTMEFLKYFAAKVGETYLLVLVLTRSDAASVKPNPAVIAQLRRQGGTYALDLEPLAPAEMQTFLRIALGSQNLSHAKVRDVLRLADGNPLFAEELLASALARRSGPPALPASIREIFVERIGQLHPDDRDILVEAAVIGRRFDPTFLARLTKRPLERILLALRRARALQLIVEDVEQVDGAVFRHALVRETLYESILIAEARGLHRRIVGALEELEDRGERIAALAYHSWAAGKHEAALRYNELAGDEAIAQLATNEAALFFERALGCAVQTDERRAALQRKLGAAYRDSGLSGRAIEMYEHAFEDARRRGDVETIVDVCFSIGREHAVRAQGDAALRWRVAGLQAAEVLPDGAFKFAAFAHAALAYAWRGDCEAADRLVQRAEQFTGARSPSAVQDLHDAVATLDIQYGRSARALERFRQASADAIAAGNTSLAVRVSCNFATAAYAVGELHIARDAAEDAVLLADEVLVPMYRPYVLADAGKYRAQAGELEVARRSLTLAEDAAAGLDAPRLHAALVKLGLILAKALDDETLDERYSDECAIDDAFASREPWWIGSIAQVFADRYGRMNRLGDAQGLIHRALAVLPSVIYSHELAITAAAYGADADLPIARERLVHWAQRATPQYGGAFVDLFDAYVARRSGQSPAALAKRAAHRLESLGLPLWAAQAYEVAGERAAAVQIYLRIGCSGDLARLSASHPIDSTQAQLTKRECEVLTFVADGRSNREIAGVMSISERTVESHIRAILSKVGGRSRLDIIKFADARQPRALRR